MWAMCDLVGKVIEIRGELNESDDRAEIVLENARQLNGEAAKLPPMSRNFDVEQRGHFSAGKSRAVHGRSTRQKRQRPTLPIQIPEDVESEEIARASTPVPTRSHLITAACT